MAKVFFICIMADVAFLFFLGICLKGYFYCEGRRLDRALTDLKPDEGQQAKWDKHQQKKREKEEKIFPILDALLNEIAQGKNRQEAIKFTYHRLNNAYQEIEVEEKKK